MSHMSKTQLEAISEMKKVLAIFKNSDGKIRPHYSTYGTFWFWKSNSIEVLCEDQKLSYIEINSCSINKRRNIRGIRYLKLQRHQEQKVINQLFVSQMNSINYLSQSNNSVLHQLMETTNGVQNEFLKVLESDALPQLVIMVNAEIPVKKYSFLGAFNGEPNITIDRLRDFGIQN